MTRILITICCLITPILASSANLPPRNLFLADSNTAMSHNEAAQQDMVPQSGPRGPSRRLSESDIDYVHTGPGHFGNLMSGTYADGNRVYWGNGIDRIVKLDFDNYEVIDEYFFPDVPVYTAEQADESIAGFDASNSGLVAMLGGISEMMKLKDLANLYTVLDKDHNYYIGDRNGRIHVYGDEDSSNSRSRIVKKNEYQLPDDITGPVMGLSMTFDGWLVVVTEHGYVAVVSRDLTQHKVIRILHSEGAENKSTKPTGYGWIRNAPAVDKDGGIYVVSQDHMHKIVWSGSRLSTSEEDGAWTLRYPNAWGHGSGATPALMGFGEEDRLVVITDGQHQMSVMAFWRDAIPGGWLPDREGFDSRIAGSALVTMGDPNLTAIQSEQSVVITGYNAIVVNNEPRNMPWYAPARARGVFIGLLGSNPEYQPYGVENFRWDPYSRTLSSAWVNADISSPSCVPIISAASNAVYLIGARDNEFTLEALDLTTGREKFHYILGGQRYNVMFAGTLIDEAGRIHYGTPWGRVRIRYQGPQETP